jgi:cytochrome P450
MLGAFETTTVGILTFVLKMLEHRDIQREVQRELDSVIGPDRMLTMEDIPQLPYLSAVIRETIRCVV